MKELRIGKGKVAAGLAATAALVLVPLAVVEVTTAGASNVGHDQVQQGGPVSIQSWVYIVPSENDLAGTLWGCTKITGAIQDESGGPTWHTTAEFAAPTLLAGTAAVNAAGLECAAKVPVGGFVHVPAPEPGQYPYATYTATPNAGPGQDTGLTALYSYQTISGQKGDIFMTIASSYNFTNSPVKVGDVEVQPFTTAPAATWVITGCTGAYTGLQGDGTWFADSSMVPWIYKPATGKVGGPAIAAAPRRHTSGCKHGREMGPDAMSPFPCAPSGEREKMRLCPHQPAMLGIAARPSFGSTCSARSRSAWEEGLPARGPALSPSASAGCSSSALNGGPPVVAQQPRRC
jgi:hypothetical protein